MLKRFFRRSYKMLRIRETQGAKVKKMKYQGQNVKLSYKRLKIRNAQKILQTFL